MDLLRQRRLRRITQAVYDGAATERGDDVGRRESRWLPGPLTVLALVVVLLVVTGGSLWHLWGATGRDVGEPVPGTQSGASGSGSGTPSHAATPEGEPSDTDAPQAQETVRAGTPTVVVYVTGHVSAPGVVELPQGSRVVDALEGAGGVTQGADVEALNLARVLADGEHIVVWALGEAPETPGQAAGTSQGAGTGQAGGSGGGQGCVDLATADEAALQTLDGVGPALAGRIVAYRDQVGTITSVEQLDEVPGIGATLVQRIAQGVCP